MFTPGRSTQTVNETFTIFFSGLDHLSPSGFPSINLPVHYFSENSGLGTMSGGSGSLTGSLSCTPVTGPFAGLNYRQPMGGSFSSGLFGGAGGTWNSQLGGGPPFCVADNAPMTVTFSATVLAEGGWTRQDTPGWANTRITVAFSELTINGLSTEVAGVGVSFDPPADTAIPEPSTAALSAAALLWAAIGYHRGRRRGRAV